jgi:hypothetical protein
LKPCTNLGDYLLIVELDLGTRLAHLEDDLILCFTLRDRFDYISCWLQKPKKPSKGALGHFSDWTDKPRVFSDNDLESVLTQLDIFAVDRDKRLVVGLIIKLCELYRHCFIGKAWE